MPTPIFNLRLDPEQKAKWQKAADRSEVKLSEWIRSACDAFAVGGVIVKVPVKAENSKRFRGPDPRPTKSAKKGR